jgi:hypothetical protein
MTCYYSNVSDDGIAGRRGGREAWDELAVGEGAGGGGAGAYAQPPPPASAHAHGHAQWPHVHPLAHDTGLQASVRAGLDRVRRHAAVSAASAATGRGISLAPGWELHGKQAGHAQDGGGAPGAAAAHLPTAAAAAAAWPAADAEQQQVQLQLGDLRPSALFPITFKPHAAAPAQAQHGGDAKAAGSELYAFKRPMLLPIGHDDEEADGEGGEAGGDLLELFGGSGGGAGGGGVKQVRLHDHEQHGHAHGHAHHAGSLVGKAVACAGSPSAQYALLGGLEDVGGDGDDYASSLSAARGTALPHGMSDASRLLLSADDFLL